MKKAFIIGNPRSGTSLLRLMLNAHPEIVAPPESGFLHWWYNKYKSWNALDSASKDAIVKYVQDVLTSKKIETWNLEENDLTEFIFKKQPSNYADLSVCVYEKYAASKSTQPSVIIDKNNYYINHLHELQIIWPDAFYIYLIRDGRDVACSYFDLATLNTNSPYKPVLPSNINSIAKEWNENNVNIQRFLNLQNKTCWIKICYEDLIADPYTSLSKITSMLNLKFSNQMLEYFNFNDEPASTLDWKKKTLDRPDTNNAGKYINRLTPDEIESFNAIAKDALQIGNYI